MGRSDSSCKSYSPDQCLGALVFLAAEQQALEDFSANHGSEGGLDLPGVGIALDQMVETFQHGVCVLGRIRRDIGDAPA